MSGASQHVKLGTEEPEYDLWEPLDPDVAGVFSALSAEDRAYRDRARAFVQDEVRPVIDGHWDRAEYPLNLARRLGELDLLRDGIDVPGFPRQSLLAACLKREPGLEIVADMRTEAGGLNPRITVVKKKS